MSKRPLLYLGLLAASVALLSACSSTSLNRAPVEDRSRPAANSQIPMRSVAPTREAIGRENLGKPGFYEVQAGDNLFRISRRYGRTVAELARWNNLKDPYIIEIGDVLRVASAGAEEGAVSRPVPAPGSASSAAAGAVSSVATETPSAAASSLTWGWPASGGILQGFDASKNKGIDIAGKAGDPVLAAADGTVVYAGSALRGYGNLLILKHGSAFVSAYAHNQTLLVKDGQSVKRGQKIAEMGQTEADRVKLHFEIRKNSTPVDPMQYLPPR